MNYYNEFDPKAAAWLRELSAAKQIPAGHVDERSIADVRATELVGFTQCHFFAGIGGWPLALALSGWSEEREVWTGSCPCQPFSAAGKRKGAEDARHLWPEFLRLISECRPAIAFGEQVASKDGRFWLAGVRTDLEGMGYAVGAADLCAAGVGAPHIRQRLYWMGVTNGAGREPGISPAAPAGYRDSAESAGSISRLADSERAERWAQAEGRNVEHWANARREEAASGNGANRNAGDVRLADSDGWQPGDGGIQRGRQHGQQQEDGGSGGAGAWSDFDLLPCADGKARRVKRGLFPLAPGLPRGLVHSRDSGVPINSEATGEARLMRLKGYGNAINAPLAAEFIMASMEAMT